MSSAVPNAAGVPPLLDNVAPADQTLLLADGVSVSTFATLQPWGIYLNGQPVVEYQSFIGIDFRQGWAIADYQVENGAFESYDKVDLPFDVRIRLSSGGSEVERAALLESVAGISETLDFYDVVTPAAVYLNCNVQHYDYRRTNTVGAGSITIELWLLEVRVIPKRGADILFPASADPINDGFVQGVAVPIGSAINAILSLVT